jgi:HEPN domain-containing protein
MKPKSARLLRKADEDFSACAILTPERLPSIVAFHVQQALEKVFKACLVEVGVRPPSKHDLLELWQLLEPHADVQINETFLKLMTAFAIEVRYDEDASVEQAKLALEEALKIRTVLLAWLGRQSKAKSERT